MTARSLTASHPPPRPKASGSKPHKSEKHKQTLMVTGHAQPSQVTPGKHDRRHAPRHLAQNMLFYMKKPQNGNDVQSNN